MSKGKYYEALALDGKSFLIDSSEKDSLIKGTKRFVWLKEAQILIAKEYVLKIEEYNEHGQ